MNYIRMTSDISMHHYSTKDDKFAPTLQLSYKNCFACAAENGVLISFQTSLPALTTKPGKWTQKLLFPGWVCNRTRFLWMYNYMSSVKCSHRIVLHIVEGLLRRMFEYCILEGCSVSIRPDTSAAYSWHAMHPLPVIPAQLDEAAWHCAKCMQCSRQSRWEIRCQMSALESLLLLLYTDHIELHVGNH